MIAGSEFADPGLGRTIAALIGDFARNKRSLEEITRWALEMNGDICKPPGPAPEPRIEASGASTGNATEASI